MTEKPKAESEARSAAEKDIGRLVLMVAIGLASLLIIWPSIKEFVIPIWRNFDEVTALKRDVADLKRDMDEIKKFFPRSPAK